MTITDKRKTKVRDHVTRRLAEVAESEDWLLPRLATDVGLDRDAYQAVRDYHEHPVVPDPPDITGPVRRTLVVEAVSMQRVIHSITLAGTEVDLFEQEPAPDGPDIVTSPRGKLDGLAVEARRTQVNDLNRSLLQRTGQSQEIKPVADLADAITAEPPSGRTVLVTITQPDEETSAVIEQHREEGRLDYFPLHKVLMPLPEPPMPTVSLLLIRGTPPLAMRYLAHDLEVSVRDEGEGLRVALEERRGWWAPPETRLHRFGTTA